MRCSDSRRHAGDPPPDARQFCLSGESRWEGWCLDAGAARASQPTSREDQPVSRSPAALLGVLAAIVDGALAEPSPFGQHARADGRRPPHECHGEFPPYWMVHSGDTYAQIAAKTGLTVAQLQAFKSPHGSRQPPTRAAPEPRVLTRPPRAPSPRDRGSGSCEQAVPFGSIAAHTGVNLNRASPPSTHS